MRIFCADDQGKVERAKSPSALFRPWPQTGIGSSRTFDRCSGERLATLTLPAGVGHPGSGGPESRVRREIHVAPKIQVNAADVRAEVHAAGLGPSSSSA